LADAKAQLFDIDSGSIFLVEWADLYYFPIELRCQQPAPFARKFCYTYKESEKGMNMRQYKVDEFLGQFQFFTIMFHIFLVCLDKKQQSVVKKLVIRSLRQICRKNEERSYFRDLRSVCPSYSRGLPTGSFGRSSSGVGSDCCWGTPSTAELEPLASSKNGFVCPKVFQRPKMFQVHGGRADPPEGAFAFLAPGTSSSPFSPGVRRELSHVSFETDDIFVSCRNIRGSSEAMPVVQALPRFGTPKPTCVSVILLSFR
jgi:hypothetical protein